MNDEGEEFAVRVPRDAVAELESQGLAYGLPALRGAALDAVVTIGTDAATLVSLLQAPDAIRAFAAWIRGRCVRSGESIELSARSNGRKIRLKVDGDVDVDVVANFLAGALKDGDSQGDRQPR